jgi:hypothetical protein
LIGFREIHFGSPPVGSAAAAARTFKDSTNKERGKGLQILFFWSSFPSHRIHRSAIAKAEKNEDISRGEGNRLKITRGKI